MSVVRDIPRAYAAPRRVFSERLAATQSEAQILVLLMAACMMIFVSQAPAKQRLAIETGADFQQEMGGVLFAWLFIMPLLAYAISWASHVIARAVGGQGSAMGARLAFAWALLVASPLWLLWGLTIGFVGPGIEQAIVGAVAFGAFVIHWGFNIFQAERRQEQIS